MSLSHTVLSRKAVSIVAILGLGTIGAFVNYYLPLELAFGITVLLGNSLAVLAIFICPHPLAALSPLLATLPTLVLWSHPWALLSYLLEGILLYRIIRQKRSDKIIWIETLYWPFVGIPLIILQYYFFLNMNFNGALAAAVKQGANAIFNMATALLIYYTVNTLINSLLRSKKRKVAAEPQTRDKTSPPKAREYLLLYINLSIIIPFFIAAFIFVRYEKDNILDNAVVEANLVMDTLAKTLALNDAYEPAHQFQLFAGFNVVILDSQRQLLWASDMPNLRVQAKNSRILYRAGAVSIQASLSETNPMLSWRRAFVSGETQLQENKILIVERPFALAVARMNSEITFSFIFLLLWLAASSSVARLFTNFFTNPLERLRLNAEHLQRDPASEVRWPEFRIMEIKELRDSLVAMTGALTNRSIELREAHRTAQELLKQSEHYLAFMGHELKAPISAMYSAIELLTDETANRTSVMNMIKDTSYNLIQLINDILDQSKARTGQLRFNNDYFVPMYEATHCMETFIIQARRKGLEFVTVIDPLLNRPVWGDKLRFRQILTNLASNAIKYTDTGYIRLRIDSEIISDQCVKMYGVMEDSGRGIEAQKLAHLWEPFAMAKGKISDTESSHGLGLSIVQAIVQAMGGSIFVKSTPGTGSIFTFTLTLPLSMPEISKTETTSNAIQGIVLEEQPITQANKPDAGISPAVAVIEGTPKQSQPQPILAGIPALVVDDERLSRMAVGYMLRSWGALVDETASGEDALQKIQEQDYRLVFMDQNMTGLTGQETARRIRELEKAGDRNKALIILSSSDLTLESDSAISICLPKPVLYEDLEKALQNLNRESLQISK